MAAPTPPASSPAAKPETERTRRRRPQRPAEDEDEDESSSEESEEESGDSEESSEEDSEDEQPARRSKPNTNIKNGNKNIKRPPPRALNPKPNRNKTNQKSSGATTGSSAPSYEDPESTDNTFRQNSYSYLPTPPSQRQPSPLRQQQQRRNPAPPQQQTGRPPRTTRPRTGTAPAAPVMDLPSSGAAEDSSYSSSSTASSAGPWKPYAPGSSGRGTPSAMPGSSTRRKTVREPAREPTQAIVPRAPRTVAAAPKIDEEGTGDVDGDGGEEDNEVEFVPRGPAASPGLPAGGKKAALAVELKLNLEIEIELKASIHGDVTLELFN